MNFGINNYRVFEKLTFFEFKPITLFIGPNNSGKSSAIQPLLLLKENILGDTFKNVLQLNNLNEHNHDFGSIRNNLKEPIDVVLFASNNYGIKENSLSFINGLTRFIFKNNGKKLAEFNADTFDLENCQLLLNSLYKLYCENKFKKPNDIRLFRIFDGITQPKTYEESIGSDRPFYKEKHQEALDVVSTLSLKLSLGNEGPYIETIKEYTTKFVHLFFENMIRIFSESIAIFGNFNVVWSFESHEFKRFVNTELEMVINENVEKLRHLYYLPIHRTNRNRYIDIYKNDLPLHSLMLKYCKHIGVGEYLSFNSKYINKWLKEFGIGSHLEIDSFQSRLYSVDVIDLNGNKRNLSDLGSGVTQVLTILFSPLFSKDVIGQIIDGGFYPESKKQETQITIYLEEPESNLHPNWQSKLMDLIVEIQQMFQLNFIIETHSEYMIRKLQYLTAKENIKPDDSQIYYINDDSVVTDLEPKVKDIRIDKIGGLSDNFGPGFYDEAINLKFELLKLNNQQKN